MTSELRSARERVSNVLRYLGYETETQEIFGTEAGDLRQLLRSKIDSCDGLVQIVGYGYGAEPPSVDPEFGRVSYTQFEYKYAASIRKKCWLIFAGDGCTRDKPVESLDLPLDSDLASASWQADRRKLQQDYRTLLRSEGAIYHDVFDDTELENAVLKTRNDSKELQEEFRRWQQDLVRESKRSSLALNLISVAISVVLVGGVLGYKHFNTEIRIPRHVDAPAIRGKLGDASARVYSQERESATREPDPKRKDELLKAADAADRIRKTRIDELVKLFSDLETNKPASDDFSQMGRILEAEGVDKALDFLESRRVDILSHVETDVNRRRELMKPLLEGAKIAVTNGRNDQADSLFKSVLEADPAWTDARSDYWSFLYAISGPATITHDSRNAAIRVYAEAERQSHRLAANSEQFTDPILWRFYSDQWRRSLLKLGDLARDGGAPKDLEAADDYFGESKQILEKIAKSDPESIHWQHELGIVYRCLGDVARDQRKWDAAKLLYQKAREFQEKPRERIEDEIERQGDLALTYQCLGDAARGRFSLESVGDALDSYNKALHLRVNLFKGDSSNLLRKHDLAIVHQKLGELHVSLKDLEKGAKSYDEARKLMDELAKDPGVKMEWKNQLATVLTCLGDIALESAASEGGGNSASRYFLEARSKYQEALAIRSSLKERIKGDRRWDLDLSTNELNLGNVSKVTKDWDDAEKRCNTAIEIRTTLALMYPEEPAKRNSLAWASRVMGDLELARYYEKEGDEHLERAEQNYSDYLREEGSLAREYPDNPEWLHEYALSLQYFGDFVRARAGLIRKGEDPSGKKRELSAKAEQFYRDALVMMEKIPTKDVQNLKWQIDLATIRCKLACIGRENGTVKELEAGDARRGLLSLSSKLEEMGCGLRGECKSIEEKLDASWPPKMN